jgi:hypothetical protein
VLRTDVDAAGAVVAAAVDADSLADAEVTGCVKQAVARWTFPAGAETVELSIPFVFVAAKD